MSSKTSQHAISMVNGTTKVNEWNQNMLAIHAGVDEILKINQHMKINIARGSTATLTYITVIEFMKDVFQFTTKLRIGKNLIFQFLYSQIILKIFNFSCPIGTRCPDDDTTVIKTKNSNPAPDLPQCIFGDLKLSIGDNLSPEHGNQCKVCTCKTPPFVTCVQTC